MLAAAVSYHRRERKAFWWAHFDRARTAPTRTPADRNVFLSSTPRCWRTGGRTAPSFRSGG